MLSLLLPVLYFPDGLGNSPPACMTSAFLPSLQLLAFLQGLFTFYHHGYELAKDFGDFKTQLTISIQNVSGGRDRGGETGEGMLAAELPLLHWHEVCGVGSWLGSEESGDLTFLECKMA